MMRQRLADAEADAERLRAAISVLEADEARSPTRGRAKASATQTAIKAAPPAEPTADAAAPPTASRQRGRRSASAKPKTRPVARDRLMAALEEHPGQTTARLAKLTGGNASQLLLALKEAESTGAARREGERRATRWFAFTDEDRVAARVKELEAAG